MLREKWGKWYSFFANFGFSRTEFVFIHVLMVATGAGALVKYAGQTPVGSDRFLEEDKVFEQRTREITNEPDSAISSETWKNRSEEIAGLAAHGKADSAQALLRSFQDAPVRQVNINQAGVDELASLPRVGPKLAQRIVEYRTQAGPFLLADDLTKVKGIGKKLLEKIRPYITL